jgi:SAM-dependent methyltransferase
MSPHLVETVTFWIAVILLTLSTYNFFFHGGMPNIRTAPAIRKKIIELLKADFEARKIPGYTVVDLGSGNGLFTREIARALPEAKVIGVEINKLSLAWSNAMRRRHKLENLDYKCMDLRDYDFTHTQAVVMFLLPVFGEILSRNLMEQAAPGTLIAANKYGLVGDWKPAETIKINTLDPLQGHLYIFRKG